MSNPWLDSHRQVSTITEVKDGETAATWTVRSDDGWWIGFERKEGISPAVGDRLSVWGRGFGYSVRGVAVNDQVVYYRTEQEQEAKHQQEKDARHAEKLAAYESKRAVYDARVAALPAPLRERIEGFRAFRGDEWRWEYEPYELASCEEAARLVKHFGEADAIRFFAKMDWHDQKREYPEMDDGHSGNTWGKAIRLALLTVERPDLAPKDHAAICAIVGCEDAGCYAVRGKSDEVDA